MMFLTRMIKEKRRYRQYQARTAALPSSYRTTVGALERYLMIFGPGTATSLQTMLDDLAELFEQSAADGTPVRVIVGDDPIEFTETFLRNYPVGQWIVRERERLVRAVDQATAEEGSR